ncbi:MAG: RNA polymerase sigma factor (TIGR02999 family) [Planctomycetota bacterium]|jgi:RNA polymerase sigma factor (TIGR02999 family)
MSDVTRLLDAVHTGVPGAADRLAAEVYQELRRMAQSRLAREPGRATLAPTALVHEAWLRIEPENPERPFHNRAHFFSAGAEAMRRILVDRARRRNALRHGGAWARTSLEGLDEQAWELPPGSDLLDLDEALSKLGEEAPRKARLVELRFFGGLSQVEAAEVLAISKATADRDWAYARAWLLESLGPED